MIGYWLNLLLSQYNKIMYYKFDQSLCIQIFEPGDKVSFKNIWLNGLVFGLEIENKNQKTGDYEGPIKIISDFIADGVEFEIKETILPDPRRHSPHKLIEYMIEAPNKNGVIKQYLIPSIYLK